jgi:hypothetical protein
LVENKQVDHKFFRPSREKYFIVWIVWQYFVYTKARRSIIKRYD